MSTKKKFAKLAQKPVDLAPSLVDTAIPTTPHIHPVKKASSISEKKLSGPHWVCTGGCKTVTNSYGRCTAVGCYRNKNPLTECQCTDGTHNGLFDLNNPAMRAD